ncbi:MAG: hypothetical protein HOI47_00660 [Candidatus Scalindua sp.]|jgi:lysophospholipase L1-like esterase|nr:hypothetical protein [Candidatus Scalindua sp.]MBT6225145.1 hypothetical protein [Candidatus Scalindua sp.]
MKKHIAIVYIACVHFFLGIVRRVRGKINFVIAHTDNISFFDVILSYHSRMDDNVPDGTVIFIGDSITQALCVSAIVPVAVNYGIGGDTTFGILRRLPTYRSICRASAVVFAVGVNDMNYSSNEKILCNYLAIAESVPNNITVIFSAVLPISENVCTKDIRNDCIKALNSGLRAITLKFENLFFVNAGPLLIDSQGNLADEYHVGDGLHLNPKGNIILIRELQKAIEGAKQYAALDKE